MEDEVFSRNTVVASGVPTDCLPPERMADKLIIHFQTRRRSDGGDVKWVRFPTTVDGVAFITFINAEDAEKVVRKQPQILMDEEFSAEYELTVFPFSQDVFFYVANSTLDLSLFEGEHELLLRKFQSDHRSIRFRARPEPGTVHIEGPFSAVKALREELICRATRLQKYDILKESSYSKVKLKADTERRRRRRSEEASPTNVSDAANFEDDHKGEKGGGAKSRADAFSDSKKELLQRQVVGEESTSSLLPSAPPLDEEEEEEEEEEDWRHMEDLSLPEKLQESSMSTAGNDSLKQVEEIWLDLLTFQYIRKFHGKELDECLGSVEMSHQSHEDLLQVSLSSREPSRISEASEKLMSFFQGWQCTLEEHEVQLDPDDLEDLKQICRTTSSLYNDVFYTFNDSHVKIIGPAPSSYLFYQRVRNEVILALDKWPLGGAVAPPR